MRGVQRAVRMSGEAREGSTLPPDVSCNLREDYRNGEVHCISSRCNYIVMSKCACDFEHVGFLLIYLHFQASSFLFIVFIDRDMLISNLFQFLCIQGLSRRDDPDVGVVSGEADVTPHGCSDSRTRSWWYGEKRERVACVARKNGLRWYVPVGRYEAFPLLPTGRRCLALLPNWDELTFRVLSCLLNHYTVLLLKNQNSYVSITPFRVYNPL